VLVELDGEPWRALPDDVVFAAAISAGEELDRPRLRQLRRALRRAEAMDAAVRALSRRELSAHEVDERLRHRGITPRERAETVAALRETGLVADQRAAGSRARVLAERGLGDAAIRHDLSRRGIASGLIEAAFAELVPEAERAKQLSATLGRGTRAARTLTRRGFSAESIEGAVGAVIAEMP
jgi:regulatory protein